MAIASTPTSRAPASTRCAIRTTSFWRCPAPSTTASAWRSKRWSIPGDYATIEADGRIQFTNPACDKYLGYQENELAGRAISDLLNPLVAQEYLEYFDRYAASPEMAHNHGTREVIISIGATVSTGTGSPSAAAMVPAQAPAALTTVPVFWPSWPIF